MQPKPKTPRDPAYLAHLRTQPCVFCGAHPPSQASHHGRHGIGIKASDYLALPACATCHGRHHSMRSSPHPRYDDMTPEQRRDAFADLAAHVHDLYVAGVR